MLIYHEQGRWFEYRTFNGNVFAPSLAAIKEETEKRFNINILSILN